jgi:hydrogenase nickel incorporation protein HypA/HybF
LEILTVSSARQSRYHGAAMHEVSICQGLIKVVLDELAQRALPAGALLRVRVVAGALHQIVPESLEFAYDLLTRATPAAGSKLELRVTPLAARCTQCAWRGGIEPPLFLCGACGAGVELEGGDELYVEDLEVAES